ncbi:FKBP-type peptidyl-prolyl cis-trans isomerase [Bacteroidota bacterium]
MKKGLLLLLCVFYFAGMGISQDKAKKDTITTKSGLKYILVKKGKGDLIRKGKKVFTHVVLTNLKGEELWTTRKDEKTFDFVYGEMSLIAGFNEAISLMKKGERSTFVLHPAIAYGERGSGETIPPNTTLVFDIEVIDVTNK